MSKAVMLSIRPKWFDKIANGEKTIEVRKTRPKMNTPFKCYIYCTLPKYPHEDFIATDYPRPQFYGGGKVIGEFICDAITRVNICGFWDDSGKQLDNRLKDTCLTSEEFGNYLGENVGYGWHISNLKIYDAPKKLGGFWRDCLEYSELSTNCWSCENVCGDGDETDCNTDGRLYLHRPPQSWCYVEAAKEGEKA
jgi:predicted transcriptional regulator